MDDYRVYYNLEQYVSMTVSSKFHEHGKLDAFDFFCIVVWKANRAKSKVAHRIAELENLPGRSLDERVGHITQKLFSTPAPKEQLRYLMEDLKFRLPMASAILPVLYPDKFTVYDDRVCGQLHDEEAHRRLSNKVNFEAIWEGYMRFKKAVEKETASHLSLRDKDRYLWGKSFHDQLSRDLEHGFSTR